MVDIREQLEKWGIKTAPPNHNHSRLGWVNVDCPWCGTVGKYHLGWSESRRSVNCWRCGPKNPYEAVMRLAPRLNPRDVVEYLQTGRSVRLPKEVKPVGTYTEPPFLVPLGPAHRKYLIGRGFDPAELEATWGVKGIAHQPMPWKKLRLSWRVFSPVVVAGQRVSWVTRSIKPEVEMRYLAAPPDCERQSIKQVIYGGDYVTHTALILEGMTDVWRVGRGAVATLGTSVTDGQILALSRYPRRVVCFDSSIAAQRRAAALAAELAPYPGSTQIVEIDGDDPASAPQAEIDALRRAFLN